MCNVLISMVKDSKLLFMVITRNNFGKIKKSSTRFFCSLNSYVDLYFYQYTENHFGLDQKKITGFPGLHDIHCRIIQLLRDRLQVKWRLRFLQSKGRGLWSIELILTWVSKVKLLLRRNLSKLVIYGLFLRTKYVHGTGPRRSCALAHRRLWRSCHGFCFVPLIV